jgi:hypothetical protein
MLPPGIKCSNTESSFIINATHAHSIRQQIFCRPIRRCNGVAGNRYTLKLGPHESGIQNTGYREWKIKGRAQIGMFEERVLGAIFGHKEVTSQ